MNFENRRTSYPNRRKLKIVSQTAGEMVVDMDRAEGEVYQAGTPVTAEIFNDWESRIQTAEREAAQSREVSTQAKTAVEDYASALGGGNGSVVTENGQKVLTFDADKKLDKTSLVVSEKDPEEAEKYRDGTIWLKKQPDHTVKLWTKTSETTTIPAREGLYGDLLFMGILKPDGGVDYPLPEIGALNVQNLYSMDGNLDYDKFNGVTLKLQSENGTDYGIFPAESLVFERLDETKMYARSDITLAVPGTGVTGYRTTYCLNLMGKYISLMALKFGGNADGHNHPFYFSLDHIFPNDYVMQYFVNETQISVCDLSLEFEDLFYNPDDFRYFELEGVGPVFGIEVSANTDSNHLFLIKTLLTGSAEAATDFDPFAHFSLDEFTLFFLPFGEYIENKDSVTKTIHKFE